MGISAQFLLAANRLLPAPALPGQSDADSYADWEYRTSDAIVELFARARQGRPAEAGQRVLDLGSGLGGKTKRLREAAPDLRWAALDLAQEHLSQSRRLHGDAVGWTRGDAAQLPFADASFDYLLSADTLEHLPDPRRVLRECARCLKPQGRFALLFNPWGSPRGSHLGDLLRLPWCHLIFGRESLADAARAEAARRDDLQPEFVESLLEHFEKHVHPTRIADLRRWILEDGVFRIEQELHVGPGPLREASWIAQGPWEEILSASYGVVLSPLATS